MQRLFVILVEIFKLSGLFLTSPRRYQLVKKVPTSLEGTNKFISYWYQLV